jgi:hypothetical protein
LRGVSNHLARRAAWKVVSSRRGIARWFETPRAKSARLLTMRFWDWGAASREALPHTRRTFQNTGKPVSTPATLRRKATGWKYWPIGM